MRGERREREIQGNRMNRWREKRHFKRKCTVLKRKGDDALHDF